jgi:hypothetical protein|tara:strand:- start:7 stop:1461 length:1455 start_codon:yes stop_codon:yes gene_type:complete
MSEIKVNKISPRAACGTVTLGDSGDSFTIPAGATITNSGTAVGFGATGSASWNTTVKTGDFTAVAGEGYFVNTTSGEIDVTLPASPSPGDVVAVKDYANTWDTNNCILLRNGSNIGGLAVNSTLSEEGLAVTLVFVDATKGWLVTDSGLQSEAPGPQYVAATGGNCVLTVCSHKVHIFTGPGTFCVSSAGNCAGANTVEYLVVAGGGGSGGYGTAGGKVQAAGGGGGGGWRSFTALPAASPLNGPAALPVSVQGYPVTVGAGGSGDPCNTTGGSRGANSVFSSITSTGGGGGGSKNAPIPGVACGANKTGGSGGGGAGRANPQPAVDQGGTGNTPPVSPSQGQPGGRGAKRAAAPESESGSGGGGGAEDAGSDCPTCGDDGQPGGRGAFIVNGFFGPTAPSYGQSPSPLAPNGRYFSGGGGGGSGNTPGSQGQPGAGGGGIGGNASQCNAAGVANTGGGGGGPSSQASKAGGSGIVVIRYRFQA